MTRTLRVVLVNGTLFGGGAEHVIATLARQLRAAGHAVTVAVIGRGGELLRELTAAGFDIKSELGGGGRFSAVVSPHRLTHLIRDRRAEIVHSHDTRSLTDVGLCRLGSGSFKHLHTFHFGNYPHLPAVQLAMERLFCRVPDQLVAVGQVQRSTIASALHVAPERIASIWNGVDASGAGTSTTTFGTVPVIGSLSTMSKQKGLPTLIDAVSLMTTRGERFRVILVGDGPMRRELQAEVRLRGLDQTIEFKGWLPDASTKVLPQLDVFVQSSYWEAMSVVILEAMAAGRAIVATAVGENPYVLADNESALLVPPRDAAALADALTRVVRDAALRDRLGRAAHEAFRVKLTSHAMATRYAAAYAELL